MALFLVMVCGPVLTSVAVGGVASAFCFGRDTAFPGGGPCMSGRGCEAGQDVDGPLDRDVSDPGARSTQPYSFSRRSSSSFSSISSTAGSG